VSTATKPPNFLSRIRELPRLRNVANVAVNSRVSPPLQTSLSLDSMPKMATPSPREVPCSCQKHCPVYKDTNGWYFWTETWADNYGPYDTEEIAHTMLRSYAREVLGS